MEKKEEKNLKDEAVKVLNDVKNDSKKFTKKEIEDGKGMSILAYISILALIPYLTEKENKYVMYHAKQGMNLFIIEVIVGALAPLLCLILFLIAPLVSLILSIVGFALLILSIIGIINVCNGEAKELPIINKIKIIK